MLRLAATVSSVSPSTAPAQPTERRQPIAAASPQSAALAVMQPAEDASGGSGAASVMTAACVVVHNKSPLDLTLGQAGTEEQLQLSHSSLMHYR